MLWLMRAYALGNMIKHYAHAAGSYRPRELMRYHMIWFISDMVRSAYFSFNTMLQSPRVWDLLYVLLTVIFVFGTVNSIKLQGIHFYIIFLSVSGNQGVNLNNEIFKISISTSIRSRRCRIRSDRVKETRRKWKASDSWKSSSFNFDLIIKAIINAGYIYVAAYAFLTDQIWMG